MNVSCPECRSVFRLDPAKITSVSMRARCSVCGGLIPVGAAVTWGDDLQLSSGAMTAAAAGPTPGGVKPITSRGRTPAASIPANAWPPPMPRAAPPPAPTPPAPQRPAPVAPRPAPTPPPNQSPAPVRHRTPPFSPKFTPSVVKDSSPAPATVEKPKPANSGAGPLDSKPVAPTGATFGAPLTPPSRTSIPQPPPKPAGAPGFAPSGNVSAAFSTPSTPAPAPAVVQRKPINPFLANDPNQKARRLARALVSDMVANHPAKRDEGLQGGTLKQLFRDEIKKSYEEYVEQVGREFAESTVHFQEALNDVLAGGRKVF